MPEPGKHSASSVGLPGGGQVVVISSDITDLERADHELQSRVRQQTTVAELGRRALSGLELPALMDETAAAVARTLGVDYCEILESSGDDATMRRRAGVGWKLGLAPGTRLPLEALGGILDLQHGLVRKVDDLFSLEALTPVLEIHKSEGVRSWISVPLIAQGELIGSLNLASDRPAAFTSEAVTVAHEVANQLAIAIRHARLSEEVHAGRERLLALSRRLVSAQEDERRRIARELHDETGQALTAAMMNLQVLRRGQVEVAAKSLIDDSLNIIEQTLQRVRDLSLDLRPSLLDDLGLVAALRWYVDRQARRAGLDGLVVVEPAAILAPAEIETTCFRVVQEALTNVARHARASRVRVELTERAGALSLVIEDDGVGFDVDEARRRARAGTSLGLLSMEERVALLDGVLEIESGPGSGTILRARFATIGAADPAGRDPAEAES